jgi:hypothetical protein
MTAAPRVWVGAAALAAATLPACDGGTPVERGFGSRQLVQIRDSSFAFSGSRGDIVLYSVGTDPATTSYLSVDLRTGAVAAHDAMYSDIPAPEYTFPADPAARYHCSYGADAMGDSELLIDDAQTGTRTTITDAFATASCPTDGDPTLKLWRHNRAGTLELWTGPYDDLEMAPLGLTITRIVQPLRATDVAVAVYAQATANSGFGLYSIDLTTFTATEVIPPGLSGGATWAEGSTPEGPSASMNVAQDVNPSNGSGGIIPIGDHFGYWRLMSDNTWTFFVGPLASAPARELALFNGPMSGSTLGSVRSTTGAYLSASDAGVLIWQRWPGNCSSSSCGSSDLLIWDDVRRRLLTCPSAFASTAVAVLSDDHDRLAAFVVQNPSDTSPVPSLASGPLLLVDLSNPAGGSAACTTLQAADVSVAGFAPDGSSLFWLVPKPYPSADAQLYLAAPDGSGPRLIGDDRIEGPPHEPHFVGPSQLEIDIDADLIWIDTHDDPVVTHPIVDRTRGGAIDRGRWLIIGYDSSQQDGTAHLGLVNRDTGAPPRQISPDVTRFFSPDIPSYGTGVVMPSPLRTASDPIRVVYLVRGRNPSPQDGVWVASIDPSDTP